MALPNSASRHKESEPVHEKKLLQSVRGRNSTIDQPNESGMNQQKATGLLFGGELYAKFLGYAGPEGISHLRDDQLWRKAMDLLPAKDMQTLNLPVVSRPKTDLNLFLLRSFLTEPVISPHTGKRCGWKLNDLATMILASSPLTSDRMLQSIVYPGCNEKVMKHILVDDNKHLSASLLQKMIISGCPLKLFERVVAQQNATSEILSAILLRLLGLKSYSAVYVDRVLCAIASHRNTNQMDLQYLANHQSAKVRAGVANNTNAAQFELLQSLAKDDNPEVRAACASNVNAPKDLLIELSMDKSMFVRKGVVKNQGADKRMLMMLASYYSDRDLLSTLQRNKNCTVDEIFSVSNRNHWYVLSWGSSDSIVLRNLVGVDGGTYDEEIASNSSSSTETLQLLAKSENTDVRDAVARNESISTEMFEQLMRDGSSKAALADNEGIPLNILEVLSNDTDEEVRQNVAYNIRTPPEILQRMATMEGQPSQILEIIYSERYNDISIDFLQTQCNDVLTRGEGIPADLARAVIDHESLFKVSLEILVALSNIPNTSIRYDLLKNSRLPVGDIIRLYHDTGLDKKYVTSSIRKNALLQIAVDKLFHLYFRSKDGVGSDSEFALGEQWW